MNFSSREIPHISSTFKEGTVELMFLFRTSSKICDRSFPGGIDKKDPSIDAFGIILKKRSSHLRNSEYRVEVPTSCKKEMVTSCAIAHQTARIITVDFFPAFNLRPNDILVGGFNPFEKY